MIVEIAQGDLNLTISKDFIVIEKTNTKLLRGRNISKYHIDYSAEEFIKMGFKENNIKKNRNNNFLVCQEITGTVDKWRLRFAITNKNETFLFGHTANKILLKNQDNNLLVLGILNSKLLDWYFRKTSSNNHVGGYEIEQLPIKIPENQQSIISLVEQILFIKKENPAVDTLALELKIDALIYKLYDLNYDEVIIIDPEFSLSKNEYDN